MLLMPGDDSDGRCEVAMGNGNACIGGYCNGRTHTGHDLEWDAGICQRQRLFASSPKDEGVPPFQAYHKVSLLSIFDE